MAVGYHHPLEPNRFKAKSDETRLIIPQINWWFQKSIKTIAPPVSIVAVCWFSCYSVAFDQDTRKPKGPLYSTQTTTSTAANLVLKASAWTVAVCHQIDFAAPVGTRRTNDLKAKQVSRAKLCIHKCMMLLVKNACFQKLLAVLPFDPNAAVSPVCNSLLIFINQVHTFWNRPEIVP